jgi:hypothetical protein
MQEPGGFELPADVLTAHDTYRTATELQLPEAPLLRHPGDVAAALVDALGRGERVDLGAAAGELVEAQRQVAVVEHARHLAAAACDHAAERATATATAGAERVIVESLQPAYGTLLAEAAKHAAAVEGYQLDDGGWDAPPRVRTARRHLAELADRHRVLRDARHTCVLLTGQTPADDVDHLFLTVRRPQMLSPEWRPPAALPRPEMPGDPVARLVWLVTTAAPAGPWLPTVDEQDGAWRELLGERADAIRAGNISARAHAGMRV